MIRIQQLKIALPHGREAIQKALCKQLHLKKDCFTWEIWRKSLDARKKPQIYAVYTIDVHLKQGNEAHLVSKCHNKNISIGKRILYQFPKSGSEKMMTAPVIIGTGPAGLFAGLMLARAGYRPILLERGQAVEQRTLDVERFWQGGTLNPESNVQFGEGGAGTFSDGKLNTLVKDVSGRNRKVLEEFVHAGAAEAILYEHKPHIGTDVLKTVVRNIRQEIQSLGGEVRFSSKVTGLILEKQQVTGVIVNETEHIPAQTVVLAIGHSARDTFTMLEQLKIPMHAKSFAVGVRVEHPQSQINLSQYGKESVSYLSAADYKLTARSADNRGVYSFCMCPGGYVVNASSESERLAVNGMSYSDRAGANANSAIIVSVTPEDFEGEDALAGIEFQRRLEEAAYRQGNGKIPVQLYEDFKEHRTTTVLKSVHPQMKGFYQPANVREIFPEAIGQAIEEGMEQFDKKIAGFARGDCLLSGVESRTSSPVRIERDESLQSIVKGLYPCGEGAGYAGGITSAAMDGIKVAEAIATRYQPLWQHIRTHMEQ